MVQWLEALAALPEIQVQSPASTWGLADTVTLMLEDLMFPSHLHKHARDICIPTGKTVIHIKINTFKSNKIKCAHMCARSFEFMRTTCLEEGASALGG